MTFCMLEIQEKKAKDEPYLALVMVIHLRYVTKDRPLCLQNSSPYYAFAFHLTKTIVTVAR